MKGLAGLAAFAISDEAANRTAGSTLNVVAGRTTE